MAAGQATPSFVNKFHGKVVLTSSEFIEIFKKFDKDGNGHIEKVELDHFFVELLKEKCGKGSDFDEFKDAVMKKYDENCDQKISMNELAMLLPTEENFLFHFRDEVTIHSADFMKCFQKKLRTCFDAATRESRIWYHYDQDKSGYLESNELKGFLCDLLLSNKAPGVIKTNSNQHVSAQAIDEHVSIILDLFDANKDGKIELAELAKILPVENFLSTFRSQSQITDADFDQLFLYYDKDNNGYIEDTELMGFLRDLLQNKAQTPTTIDLETYRTCILEMSDHDKDGRLSKAELKLLLLS